MSIASLIEKLKQVMSHASVAHLFSDEVEKLEKLHNHIRRYEALLSDHELPTKLIRRIDEAVNRAEYAIKAYVTGWNRDNDPVNIVRTTVEKIEALLQEIIRFIDSQKADVEFLIEKLKQLVVHDAVAHLFSYEVDQLDYHLRRFKALGRIHSKVELPTEQIRRIRDAVYEAEDAIDAYVTQKNPVNELKIVRSTVEEIEALLQKFIRCIDSRKTTSKKSSVALLIEKLNNIIRCIDSQKMSTSDSDDDPDFEKRLRKYQYYKLCRREKHGQNVVVGIEDETEKLSTRLMKGSEEFQVLAIIGMAGLGKTILAQKIFHDARIVHHFPKRIWVYVSQVFTPNEIFLDILKEFTLLTDDIMGKTDKELADLVVGFLENESFLLVMDDLWSLEHWDKLKVAIPTSNGKGRVLITTRILTVSDCASSSIGPYLMRRLGLDDSIKLLGSEVFRGLDEYCSPSMSRLGSLIADTCRGHPLAIILIGGILSKERSLVAWRKVYKSLTYPTCNDPMERMQRIIAMSYENLSYHLRECFLYFGMFPEDFKISVWKLIRLWIAEGFILHKSYESLETSAENYLQELIDRNLVSGVTFKLNGKVKTCRVHDLIRDFCIDKAASDRVFQQINMSDDGGFEPQVDEELKFRRLCIHSNALSFFSKKPNGPSVRSFLCSSREEMEMPMKDLPTIPKGFKSLKVLDVEPINFNLKLPRDMFQLLQLKCLFLSVKINVLPSAFSQLLNIQTLVFKTSTRTLEIRAGILSLTQLRHFKTKASAALSERSIRSSTAGENFQTLGNISPESCTNDVFDRARNLNKLSVRGNLALLLDGEKKSFDSLGKLGNLEKLKLLHDVFPIPPSGFPVLSLPPPNKFPPKLKILTLSRTCLDWFHMSIIGSLENLEILKLENKAFVGDTWEVTGAFRHLKVLRIERMNLKIWLASDDQFPKLKHLQLRHCNDLQRIPFELANVLSFWKLELFHCKRAAASAREIEAKKKPEEFAPHEIFDLSISPFQ